MNRSMGMYAAAVNFLAVLGFAVCMLAGSSFGNYLSSMAIAFSFVVMICALAHYGNEDSRVPGLAGIVFGGMYALCNLIVYYVQLTVVLQGPLSEQAASLLDFEQFGLIFNLDMLGYCLMSLSTFFASFTIQVKSRAGQWLKWLLRIHGIFAISCFVVPFLGLFSTASSGNDMSGVLVLEFWCLYFAPISALSLLYVSKIGRKTTPAAVL